MATKTKKAKRRPSESRLTGELLETARDMRASGLMTDAAHDNITMRHMPDIPPPASDAIV
jgi:putative transcriptional regulator